MHAINSGDTAWVLASTALVLLMTAPGLALFYGGLVRRRNFVSVLMQSLFILCAVSVQWALVGYSLSFGADHGSLVGGLEHFCLAGVGQGPAEGTAVPQIAFALYQAMFAAITVALMSGAVAERMRFQAFVLFGLAWSTVIYDPLAHWVWGGGWLMKLGALDFAGGTVVHVSSGVSALVLALVVGKRAGYPARSFGPHSVVFTVVGGALLWFGWFGFNAGSALAANGLAAQAFATTHVAAAAAGCAWVLLEIWHRGKASLLGLVTGAVAGLVTITPAAGYVTIASALAIGATGAAVGYLGVNVLKSRLGYDDSLDVFGIHGLCGTWGALTTGIFADAAVNPAGADGLLLGNAALLGKQAMSVGATALLAAVGTFVALKLVACVTPLRVTAAEEEQGLDLVLHGELAYEEAPERAPVRIEVGEVRARVEAAA